MHKCLPHSKHIKYRGSALTGLWLLALDCTSEIFKYAAGDVCEAPKLLMKRKRTFCTRTKGITSFPNHPRG